MIEVCLRSVKGFALPDRRVCLVSSALNFETSSDRYGFAGFQFLPPGEYLIKALDKIHTVNVDNNRNRLKKIHIFEDKYDYGMLEVMCLDIHHGTPEHGAAFYLYDDKNNLTASRITNRSGIADFCNLPYGRYTLRQQFNEVVSDINNSSIKINIDSDFYAVTVYNRHNICYNIN